MLVKSNQIYKHNVFDRLPFIEQQSSLFEIPVVKNSRLGCNIVYYRDINRLHKSSTVENIFEHIGTVNNIDNIKLALSESEFLENYFDHKFDPILSDIVIYKDPISEDVVNFLQNIDILLEQRVMGASLYHGTNVDNPDELVYLANAMNKDMINLIQGMFNAKSENEFNMYKDALKRENTMKKLNAVNQYQYHKSRIGIGDEHTLHVTEKILEDKSKNLDAEKFPKSVIAKAIQKLRSLYQGLMFKCDETSYWDAKLDNRIPRSTKTKILTAIKSVLKHYAYSILKLIDILLHKLQHASDYIASAGSRLISNLKGGMQNSVPSIQPAMA